MKQFKLLFAIVAVLAASLPCNAQLRFGVKAGIGINSLDVTSLDFNKENATGYTVGAMVDFTVPVVGLGVDASLMYARRDAPVNVTFSPGADDIVLNGYMEGKDYLDVPINIKYAFNIPSISGIVKPFIVTGPSFAFNLSGENSKTELKLKKAYTSWNLGVGVELVKHLQLGFNYRWGLDGLTKEEMSWTTREYKLKSNGWCITAAYLF